MTDLDTFKTRLLTALGDPDGVRYSAAQLEEALRQALEEYSQSIPQILETTLTVVTAGGSQPVSAVKQMQCALEVVYPYDPNAANQASYDPWYIYVKDGSHWLLFGGDAVPQVGELILIRYAASHTLTGLDGAAVTSLPDVDEGLLALGAAGYAAVMRAAAMVQAYGKRNPQDESLQHGKLRLEAFRRQLENSPSPGMPAKPWSMRWSLDGWDV